MIRRSRRPAARRRTLRPTLGQPRLHQHSWAYTHSDCELKRLVVPHAPHRLLTPLWVKPIGPRICPPYRVVSSTGRRSIPASSRTSVPGLEVKLSLTTRTVPHHWRAYVRGAVRSQKRALHEQSPASATPTRVNHPDRQVTILSLGLTRCDMCRDVERVRPIQQSSRSRMVLLHPKEGARNAPSSASSTTLALIRSAVETSSESWLHPGARGPADRVDQTGRRPGAARDGAP